VWWLPVLFVLWVNLDGWFILGPLTVALFLLGELVQKRFFPIRSGPDARPPGYVGTLAKVLGVGVLACFLSPHHYRAFTLPPELSYLLVSGLDSLSGSAKPGEAVLSDSFPDALVAAGKTLKTLHQQDPSFGGFPSALSGVYWQPATGLNTAGLWAYGALLLAGLVSFGLNTGVWPLGRLAVWLGFALLSVAQVRCIPFFAVVAGPITALNIQDLVAQRFGTQVRVTGSWKAWSLAGRAASVVLGLVLLALSWPGWLHGLPDSARMTHRVAWHVEPQPNLREAAEQLGRALKDQAPVNCFNYSPEMAHYLAWYCPGHKSFLDYRFALFGDRAEQFVRVRKSLSDDYAQFRKALPRPASYRPLWKKVFGDGGIRCLILATPVMDRPYLDPPLLRQPYLAMIGAWNQPGQWDQPDVGGLSTLFGWKGPGPGGASPFSGRPLNLDALAFGPDTPNRAPGEGLKEEVTKATLLSRFRKGPAATPWGVAESWLYTLYYNFHSQEWPLLHRRWTDVYVTASRLAACPLALVSAGPSGWAVEAPVAAAAYWAFPTAGHFPLGAFLEGVDNFVPKGAPVLAVRAARRAVAENPDDPEAHLRLALACKNLWKQQEDPWCRRRPVPLCFRDLAASHRQLLRAAEVISALHRALRLRPGLAEAHLELFKIYVELNYLDVAVEHLRELVKYERAHSPVRQEGEKAETFEKERRTYRDRMKERERLVKALEAGLKERQRDYRLLAANRPVGEKVFLALIQEYPAAQGADRRRGRGLAREALNLLLKAPAKEVDLQSGLWKMQLLITLGEDRLFREHIGDFREGLERVKKSIKARPEAAQDRRTAWQKSQFEFSVPWFETLLAAADGDFRGADRSLARLQKFFEVPEKQRNDSLLGFLWCNLTLETMVRGKLYPPKRAMEMAQAQFQYLLQLGEPLKFQTQFRTLRGLLALEEGRTRDALNHFAGADKVSQDLSNLPERHLALRYRELLERQAKKKK
jgi:tetratricopeptide (TPR) repeat protein